MEMNGKYLMVKKNPRTGECFSVHLYSDTQLANHVIANEDTENIILSITNLKQD